MIRKLGSRCCTPRSVWVTRSVSAASSRKRPEDLGQLCRRSSRTFVSATRGQGAAPGRPAAHPEVGSRRAGVMSGRNGPQTIITSPLACVRSVTPPCATGERLLPGGISDSCRPVAVLRFAGLSARYLTFGHVGSERQFPTHCCPSHRRVGRPKPDIQTDRHRPAVPNPQRTVYEASSSPRNGC